MSKPKDPPRVPDASPEPAALSRFRVTLHCPTPIPHPQLEVEAADGDEAWRKFCAANGISDSEHERTIVPVSRAAAGGAP